MALRLAGWREDRVKADAWDQVTPLTFASLQGDWHLLTLSRVHHDMCAAFLRDIS